MATCNKADSTTFVIEPSAAHTHTFILLHGLGSNGEKFGAELIGSGQTADGLRLTDIFPGAKFVFPTAARQRARAFGRAKLTQWFDIASLEDPSLREETQFDGFEKSALQLGGILKTEMELVPTKNIVLGGLSQGCAMAISMLLGLEHSLGAFVGMSGWLPFRTEIDNLLLLDNKDEDDPFNHGDGGTPEQHPILYVRDFERDVLSLNPACGTGIESSCIATPVFLGHGTEDEKVKFALGRSMSGTLASAGLNVVFKGYEGQGHWYKVPDEIQDIVDFLESILP